VFRELFVTIVLLPSAVLAQGNLTDTTTKPLVTPIGDLLGNAVTAKMDSKGGLVTSADGKLEIIFPAGALDVETPISVQATHNELTEDDEGSYQLEPSGLTFKKPLQLTFHYSGSNDNADLKSVGWQDSKGQWYLAKNTVTDTIHKTVTTFANHFSGWAKFDKLSLVPRSASVKVNKTIRFVVSKFETYPAASSSGDDELAVPQTLDGDDALLATPEGVPSFYTSAWSANSIVNGDHEVGTLMKQDAKNSWAATYKAPASVPSGNPVAVSVQIYSDKKTRKLLLTSNVTVIGDQYHFTYIHIDENGCYFLVDSSSCIFNFEKDKVSISNIINYKPTSDWPNCGGCRYDWTNKATIKGLTEITGIAGSAVTPSKESGPTNVNINFSPAMGNTPSATVHCKGGDRSIPSMSMPAVPTSINFDIDGDDVVIHYAGKTGRNELVIPAKNEKTMIYIYKIGN
jgi:hypothetical protein